MINLCIEGGKSNDYTFKYKKPEYWNIRNAPILKRLKYNREHLAKELLDQVSENEEREKVYALKEIAVLAVQNVN